MSLPQGTRLGVYEVIAQIGAGGMGEVYRATDSRLKRQVALKLLPEQLSADLDQLARFQREAEVLASLNHPNIAGIYGLEAGDGRSALVMEFVDGEDLAQRLTRGAIPLDDALTIAKQIADALEAAHEQGIVHRGLKPANIKVRPDGTVKVLDFGLAKALGQSPAADDGKTLANSPTFTSPAMTMQGVILGTAAYMAPEQAKGRPVDRRADIWAFGVVLYEMLTGRRLFDGQSLSEILAAVLTSEPNWNALPPSTPSAVRRLLRRCLERDPRQRLSSIGDARLELAEGDAAPVPMPAAKRSAGVWIAAALVVMGALGIGIVAARRTSTAPTPVSFLTKTWDDQYITNARFLADGESIIFSSATVGNTPSLYTLRAGTVVPQLLGDPATQLLSVSSKGELAVLVNAKPVWHRVYQGTLSRMMLDGSPKAWLEHVTEADWTPDGNGVAIIKFERSRWTLEYPPGHVLYETTSGYLSDPRLSPDGKTVAFMDHPTPGDDAGSVKVIEDGAVRLIGSYWGVEGLAWSADGESLYFSASQVGLDNFHPYVARAHGDPQPHTAVPSPGFMQTYDVAKDGRLLVAHHKVRVLLRGQVPGESAEREFPWLDVAPAGELSADGRLLAFGDQNATAGPNNALAIRDLRTDRVIRFGEGLRGRMSPNGQYMLSYIVSTGVLKVFPTGAGEPITISTPAMDYVASDPGWMPDSRTVVFCGRERGKTVNCLTRELSAAAPQPLGIDNVTRSLLSADGRFLLTEAGNGRFQVTTLADRTTVDVKGLTSEDQLVDWSTDNRSVFVQAYRLVPARVDRVDRQTGTRTAVKELAPPSKAGVNAIMVSQWADDGRRYVYGYSREVTQLFVVSGVPRN